MTIFASGTAIFGSMIEIWNRPIHNLFLCEATGQSRDQTTPNGSLTIYLWATLGEEDIWPGIIKASRLHVVALSTFQ